MMKKAVSLTISGKVQGVGFRWHTKQTADELNISGFVKNRSDGSVYVEAVGEDYAIEQFIEWCKQGPSWARVENVTIGEIPLFETNGFRIS